MLILFYLIIFVLTGVTGVGWKWVSSGGVSIAHNQDVISSVAAGTEGVLENTARTKDNFGVVTWGLVGRTSVKVPLRQGFDASGLKKENIKEMS